MKTWDVVIIGGGIIGLSLALQLRKHGAGVLVVERGEPGREASYAAAGMLAYCDPHCPDALRPFLAVSAMLYPEFVHELEDESGQRVDLRREGAIILDGDAECLCQATPLDADALAQLEPGLTYAADRAELWPEGSVDPRALTVAALKAAKHRGIDVASGTTVTELQTADGRATGVKSSKSHFPARAVVNCAGAWAGQVSPSCCSIPTRPVKGQMLAILPPQKDLVHHVVRSPRVYLVPRTDGRLLIGATVEEAGFDKRTVAATIQRMHQCAANLVPDLGQARILEAWAGLRPGTPDDLPILGRTALDGYFVAAGHFRDGILLAPITATVMAQVVRGQSPEFDLGPFSVSRFG